MDDFELIDPNVTSLNSLLLPPEYNHSVSGVLPSSRIRAAG